MQVKIAATTNFKCDDDLQVERVLQEDENFFSDFSVFVLESRLPDLLEQGLRLHHILH